MTDPRSTENLPRQADLFAHVLDAYLASPAGELDNASLYARIAGKAGLSAEAINTVSPIGTSGKPSSLIKRTIRWTQQTFKAMDLLEHGGERGVWRLTQRNRAGLHESRAGTHLVAFSTDLGMAVWGSCTTATPGLQEQVHLVITSPPYLLRKCRSYGNPTDERAYVEFVVRAIEPLVKRLVPGGSVCLNLGNDSFEPGLPSRSLYLERLLLALHEKFQLQLMDRICWYNPSRCPGPVIWSSIARVQLNSAHEWIYWLTNDASKVRSDNRRVLQQHSERHLALIARGGEQRDAYYGDRAYHVRPGSYSRPTRGRIPRNVLVQGHRCADTLRYRADAERLQLPSHGAMQPLAIADFLIRFLTEEGDLVIDPFGGTAKTGMAAEKLRRRWVVVEKVLEYVRASAERFRDKPGFLLHPAIEAWPRVA